MNDQLTPTPVSEWKASGPGATPVELPSGKVAILKRPGMEHFLKSGVIPNSLMGIIMEQFDKAKDGKKVTLDDFASQFTDESRINDLVDLMEAVTMAAFVDPVVYPLPIWSAQDVELGHCQADEVGQLAEAKRLTTRLYVDEVDSIDKQFVFNYAMGGSRDLERFRQGLAEGLDAVLPRQPVAKPTKRTAGARAKKS